MTDSPLFLFLDFLNSFWKLAALFFIFSTFFNFLFKKIFKFQQNRGWKWVEVSFLVISFIGIVGVVEKSRIVLDQIKYQSKQENLKKEVDYFQKIINLYDKDLFCRTSVKTWASPPNYDEIVKNFDDLCKIIPTVGTNLKNKINKNEAINIEELTAELSVAEKNKILWTDVSHIIEEANQYNSVLTDFQKAKPPSGEDTILVLLAPLLLTVSLSLRMSKVFS